MTLSAKTLASAVHVFSRDKELAYNPGDEAPIVYQKKKKKEKPLVYIVNVAGS